MKDKIESRVKEILYQVAKDKEFIIETIEVMPDQIHLFITAHPKISPIVKMSKGITGRLLLKEFYNLKKLYKGYLYNKSYYIENQKYNQTFKLEFKPLANNNYKLILIYKVNILKIKPDNGNYLSINLF